MAGALNHDDLIVMSNRDALRDFYVGMRLQSGKMIRAIDYEHNAIYLWEVTWWRRTRHAVAVAVVTAFWRTLWRIRLLPRLLDP
jgi:hypothetical protein